MGFEIHIMIRFEKKMQIIFVRHGQSENNVISLDKLAVERTRGFELARSADPSVTDIGRSQISRAAEHLAQRGLFVERIYCSFMQRALQSTEIIQSYFPSAVIHLGVDLFEVGGMYKLDGASNEFRVEKGITPRVAMERWPGVVIPKEIGKNELDDAWYRGTTKETHSEGVARAHRVVRWMQELSLETSMTSTRIVITHGDFLNTLVKVVDPSSVDGCVRNGSLTRFDVDSCGVVSAAFIGEMELPGPRSHI